MGKVTDVKIYYCKYCGAQKKITTQFSSYCSACKTQKAMIRKPEDKIIEVTNE